MIRLYPVREGVAMAAGVEADADQINAQLT